MKCTKILRMLVIALGFGLPGDLRCKYIYSSGAGEARRKKKRVRQKICVIRDAVPGTEHVIQVG